MSFYFNISSGLEGNICETVAKEISEYILFEEPDEKNVKMKKEENRLGTEKISKLIREFSIPCERIVPYSVWSWSAHNRFVIRSNF